MANLCYFQDHPIILALLEKVSAGASADLADTLHVLFESTAISSGYSVRNPQQFAKKMQAVIKKSLALEVTKEEEITTGYSEAKAEDDPDKESNKEESHDEL